MTYRAAKDFSAPAEVVFDVVTDPDRLARWLPGQLRVADTGRESLHVSWQDRPQQTEYRLVVLPERLRAEWRPSGPEGWSGFLQVRESPAGGATAEVCVEPTGHVPDQADRVPGLLDTALANLRREVGENLTAG